MSTALTIAFIIANSALTCSGPLPTVYTLTPEQMESAGNDYGVYTPKYLEIVIADNAGPWVLVHEVAHWCGADETEARRIHRRWMQMHEVQG